MTLRQAQDTAQVIRLEVDDDITIVRARLEKAEAPRVLLVVPPGCQALDSLLDLKLLQRYSQSNRHLCSLSSCH